MRIRAVLWNHRLSMIAVLSLGAFLWMALASACQPITPPPSPTSPRPVAVPTAQVTMQQLLAASKHADTYIVNEEGANNDCARCHSPLNWIPTSPDDMPATCATCKFTIKTPKPVTQADWKSIGCEQCHKTEKETVTEKVAWLNTAISQFETSADPYEEVKTNTELCQKCHRDSYQIDLGKGAHATKNCTDCHNAHSTRASCTAANCHADALKPDKPIAGHDAEHAKVNCVACHDAAGWKAQPVQGKDSWLTFRPTSLNGKPNPMPYVSHNLQRQVDCARCHFDGNPWNLKTDKSYTPSQ